ncbi:MAG: electron transfer flavoprotein subunit alpha/FixB family protein [Phototrophicaceae bacterium]
MSTLQQQAHTLHDFIRACAPQSVMVAGGKGLAFTRQLLPPHCADPFAWRVQDNFQNLLLPLAEQLGGRIAASRAVIDYAEINPAWQVGQSGRVVSVDLYIAVGISGAVQHLDGILTCQHIVAINKDPLAPIFRVAQHAVIADAHDFLSVFLALLREHSTSGLTHETKK